jgi:hypothetical protein
MVFKQNSSMWVLFWQMCQKMKEYHDPNTCHQTNIKLINHWIQICFPQKCLLYCISSLNVSKKHVCVDWDVEKTHKIHKWPTNVILIVIYATLIFVVPLVHFSFTTQHCKNWPNLNCRKGGKSSYSNLHNNCKGYKYLSGIGCKYVQRSQKSCWKWWKIYKCFYIYFILTF